MASAWAGPGGIAATFADVRSICLWRSLISRYFTWKLRQNAPRSQRASGRVLSCARCNTAENTLLSDAGSAHSPISTYEPVGT